MSWDALPSNILKNKIIRAKDVSVDNGRILSYRQAINEALFQALKIDHRVFVFGEGVDDNGGIFGTTLGLYKEFGKQRVFDTPICENTLTGVAIGASLAGLRPVLVHMRTDFLFISLDQLLNHAAKWKYMCGGKVSVPLVIRAIIGGGWGSAAQHSQPIQGLLAHIPGLKIVMPATAYDVKGLLLASIFGDSPVIFIEHRWLYDNKGKVPLDPYFIPLGKSKVVRQGKDVSLIADSFMVDLALQAIEELEREGIDVELIDLRCVKPLDYVSILASVKKTGRALVLDFGYRFCGISSEVSSFLAEQAWAYLKAPVMRLALPDIPTPASQVLEKFYYPDAGKIVAKVKELLKCSRKRK